MTGYILVGILGIVAFILGLTVLFANDVITYGIIIAVLGFSLTFVSFDSAIHFSNYECKLIEQEVKK